MIRFELTVVVMLFWSMVGAADLEAGRTALDQAEYATGHAELLSDAEAGNAEAQYELGDIYERGEGVPADEQEAMKWYRMAADQGHALAGLNLIRLVMSKAMDGSSQARERLRQEAAKWFRPAAEQGIDIAQIGLGYSYERGWGVPQDDREAVKWFRMAAEQGSALGQFPLFSYNPWVG